jgi:Rieske Fe-S protein
VAPNQIADTGCAHCGGGSSRREFLTTSAAAAAATLLAAACGGGAGDVALTTGPVALTVQVSNYPALANVGGITQINASGTPLAVVRTGTDTFSAFSLICPHRGCTVAITGSSFQCPCHGARFSSTGTWTGGQRTSNLYSLSTSYDSSTGVLTING